MQDILARALENNCHFNCMAVLIFDKSLGNSVWKNGHDLTDSVSIDSSAIVIIIISVLL